MNGLDSMVVPVYHGTRQSLASAIVREGLRPTAVADQIAAVAQTYGVQLSAIQEHLVTTRRFSVLHADRAGTISTTADDYKAGSWAERAPEATWDALRAVFALTHPDLDDDYAISDAAEFWVIAQRIDDPPVVVTMQAPLGALQSHGFSAGRTASESLREMLSETQSSDPTTAFAGAFADFADLFRRTPEWRIPIDAVEVVAVSDPVPSRVSPSLLAYLSERSLADLGSPRQCAAAWGTPGGEGQPGGDWWPFDRVWGLLSSQRRAELEEFAGRSLSSGPSE